MKLEDLEVRSMMHLKASAFLLQILNARPSVITERYKTKQTPWPLVRERTIPTERPPLVDEI
jgi:hypothetical protein